MTKFVFILLVLISAEYVNANLSCIPGRVPPDTSAMSTECDIKTFSGKNYESVYMKLASDTSIVISKKNKLQSVQMEDIRSITIYRHGFGRGALIGAGAGFLGGFVIGVQKFGFSNKFNLGSGVIAGVLAGFATAIITGGITALIIRDRLYEFETKNIKTKYDKIKWLIEEYPR